MVIGLRVDSCSVREVHGRSWFDLDTPSPVLWAALAEVTGQSDCQAPPDLPFRIWDSIEANTRLTLLMNKEEFCHERAPAAEGPWVTVRCPGLSCCRGTRAGQACWESSHRAGTCITSPPWPGLHQSSALFVVAAQPPSFGRPAEPAALAHASGGIGGVWHDGQSGWVC